MPRRLVEHPLVQRWRLRSSLRSAPQYSRLVQRCLLKTGCASPGDASPSMLLEHVLGLTSESVQRKTVSALEAFFGDLAGELGADPAAGLARKVHDRLRDRNLRRDMLASGIQPDVLLWRDVARATFQTDRAHRLVPDGTAVPPALKDLSHRLLDRLKTIQPDELERFLESPVFFGDAIADG